MTTAEKIQALETKIEELREQVRRLADKLANYELQNGWDRK